MFLLVVSGCGGSSETATPETTVVPAETQAPTTSGASSGTATPETTVVPAETQAPTTSGATNDLRGLVTHLDVECLDRVLGVSRTDEIVYGGNQPTAAEVTAVSGCPAGESHTEPEFGSDHEAGHDSDASWFDSEPPEDPVSPGDTVEFHGTPWTPSPDDARCLYAAIGEKAFRAIYQGERIPSPSEVEGAQQCLHGGLTLDAVVHPLSEAECPPLDLLEMHRRDYAPRWDQLACHVGNLSRLEIPPFRTSGRFHPVLIVKAPANTCSGALCQSFAGVNPDIWRGDIDSLLHSMEARTWEEYGQSEYDGRDRDLVTAMRFTDEEFPSANASMIPMADFPPYIDELHRLIEYPQSDYWHDRALRVYAIHIIQRKLSGYITWLVNFWPPGQLETPTSNPEEFRSWIDEVFVTQKIHEAKVAELLEVELFTPWPIEIERFVLAQRWAETSSDQDLLGAAQYLLDTVSNGVRPYFDGRIVPHSYVHHERDSQIWRELSYADFEEVTFNLFPECNQQETDEYLQGQLSLIDEIVNRDQLTWSIGEMELGHHRFTGLCGTNLADQADEIHGAMLDKIFEQSVAPVGISVLGNLYSVDHRDVLEERLFFRE